MLDSILFNLFYFYSLLFKIHINFILEQILQKITLFRLILFQHMENAIYVVEKVPQNL